MADFAQRGTLGALPKRYKYQESAVAFGFILAALGFVFGSLYTERKTSAVDRKANDIVEHEIRSVEQLSTMGGNLNRFRRLIRSYAYSDPTQWPTRGDELSPVWGSVEDARLQFVRTLAAPQNIPEWIALETHLEALRAVMPTLLAAIETRQIERVREVAREGMRTSFEASDIVNTLVLSQVTNAEQLARQIEKHRRDTVSTAHVLNGAAIALTLLTLVFATWIVRNQRKTLEDHNAALQARAEEMEQFAGRVAHDILTPIGVASLALDATLRGSDRTDLVRSAALRGRAAISRAKQIVEGLLEFARSGAHSSKDVSSNVAEVFHGLHGEFAKSAEEAGVSLTMDGPAIYVACDVGVLTSILSNLVRNALKYIGERPEKRVEVRAVGEANSVLFEVHDTGPGIPPSLGERAFEPYVRGEDSGQPGLGLGLATVKRLVEGHGGAIGVVSRPGHGSLFWFRLPRVLPSTQPTRERRRSTRFRAKLEAELAAGSRWVSAQIINISRGGLLARAQEPVPKDVPLTVKLAGKNPIVGEGYVRRSTEMTGEQEIAIEFRHDLDFIASLDQLLVESTTRKVPPTEQ